jgi:hypothetical protein
MYVIEDRNRNADGRLCWSMLHEMSEAELAAAVAVADANQEFTRVGWEYAHRWVLADGPHCTPLYVDDIGRVRRARDTSWGVA